MKEYGLLLFENFIKLKNGNVIKQKTNVYKPFKGE